MKLNIGKSFADVVKGSAICGTIKEVGSQEFTDAQTKETRDTVYLRFEEWPDAPRFYLNRGIAVRLMAKLGDETDAWKGQLVPMERVKVPNPQLGGQLVDKYYPLSLEDWDEGVRQYKAQQRDASSKSKARR